MSAAGSAAFVEAVGTIAAAMRQVGGSYRLDLYVDKRYDESAVAALGQQRLSTVQLMFLNAGDGSDPNGVPRVGKTKRDGDPRLEIVKTD
jgi:hypothetical protein